MMPDGASGEIGWVRKAPRSGAVLVSTESYDSLREAFGLELEASASASAG